VSKLVLFSLVAEDEGGVLLGELGESVLLGGGENWFDVGSFFESVVDIPTRANNFAGFSNVSLGSSSIFGRCTTFAYT